MNQASDLILEPRRFSAIRLLSKAAAWAVVAFPLLWAVDPWRLFGNWMVLEQFLVAELVAALVLVLMNKAASANAAPARLWLAAAVFAMMLGFFLFRHFGSDAALFIQPTPWLLLLAASLILFSLVCSWLAVGFETAALVAGMLMFGYLAQYLDSPFNAAPITLDRLLVYMVFGGEGLLGRTIEVIAGTVTLYLLFAVAFEVSGGTGAIDALARRLAGKGSGVSIKATVVSSGLFGMISGSATTNVVTSGAVTIGAMKRFGVPASTAGGIEAVSSTIGQVAPPVMGTAAFLMADITGMSYGNIALAAAMPAFLCFAVMYHQGTWLGRKIERQAIVDNTDMETLGDLRALKPTDWWQIVPVLVILVLMFKGDRAVNMAGIWGTVAALGIGILLNGAAVSARKFAALLEPAARSMAQLIVAGSALGVFVAVLNLTGLDVSLTLMISRLGESSFLLSLLLTALAAFVLGTGMSTSGVYIVAGTLLAPGLVKLGVPVVAAHLFVLYNAMLSMITPPVAFAALAASGISGASFSSTAWASMRYGWFVFVLPFIFIYQPALLLVGSKSEIIMVMTAALLCVSSTGFLVSETQSRRLLLAAIALSAALAAMLVPSAAGHAAGIAGIAVSALLQLALKLPVFRKTGA